MKDVILHAVTRHQLDNFRQQPSHAVMLVGPPGSGKHTLAVSLASQILEVQNLAGYAYKTIITPQEGRSIGIEEVRGLEHFLSLKVPRPNRFNRCIIFEEAQLMTLEAQNALLKTLEEPPDATLAILNVNHALALLPTIRSRAQLIEVKRPEKGEIKDYFKAKGFADKQVAQAYAISGGLPGLMTALLEHQTDHPLLLATERARQLLNATAYERLSAIEELAKQRQLALDTAFILQQMAHVSLQTASGQSAQKWQAVLTASYQAAEALRASAQPKLALTNLALSL